MIKGTHGWNLNAAITDASERGSTQDAGRLQGSEGGNATRDRGEHRLTEGSTA